MNIPAIRKLLDPYDRCQLECDGMTRVLHTVLTQQGVSHRVMMGYVTKLSGQIVIPLHWWIELPGGYIVDYRARMWIGSRAHHGIFKPTRCNYVGVAVEMRTLDDRMFRILTS